MGEPKNRLHCWKSERFSMRIKNPRGRAAGYFKIVVCKSAE
jgi:hypothetical protein